MSYDRLMQDAKQIEKSAAEAEYIQRLRLAGRAGAMAVDRGEIEAKYENCAQPLF
ncbi:hypothetical protein FHX42_003695 [Saccharopolyspora lacisalsi]|uniref:Uncharacterized protein n=1 Tax=Halosaccharopolyspora lacisalsi TaxID=1000566 RepID=A0A839E075_9PSEU|nr:hypothetical protein [Halosaccharopolyspora lacisalsi]MBA8826319.1 hypothetical protein [Halosaccharopolyspora lacisalsi]